MIALSIRQPWAWLIIHGGKDIENRCWPTRFRGRFLIHAAKGMTKAEYSGAVAAIQRCGGPVITLPAFHDLERGGIVGSVDLVDCVQSSESQWFTGPFGFVLRNPQRVNFSRWRGRLGFFEVAFEAGEQNG
jgi:ASCH domain